jgi:uncharacterized protein (DUF58 family)
MLTARGWWFLLADLAVLMFGVFDTRHSVVLIGFAILFWFMFEWFVFVVRVGFALPRLTLRRTLGDERGKIDALWAGRSFHVRGLLELDSELSLGPARLTDLVPFGVEYLRGEHAWRGSLKGKQTVMFEYTLRCRGAGRIRFEGVTVQVSDLQGFFVHETFLHDVVSYRVLPPLADARGRRPSVKRHNLLPAPGVHRHMRPGSGSELLDLRDYLPGDPPKTIAWKVSARRDRLITKEFESEVPLRCTFFLDSSQGVRLGPPGRNALARLVEISAAAAQAAAGVRDLTGLTVIDDSRVILTVRPGRGPRHLADLLRKLAGVADQMPATGTASPNSLLPLAYALAQRVYPRMLQPDVNRIPFWLPLFWRPAGNPRKKPLASRLARWAYFAVGFVPLISLSVFMLVFSDFFAPLAAIFLPLPDAALFAVVAGVAVGAALHYYALLNFVHPLLMQVFSGRRQNLLRWRKQLAAILTVQHHLPPAARSFLMESDEILSLHLQRFLAEHHVPYPIPLYDADGRYLFAGPGKVEAFARALLRAVGNGRDNELFVLLVDLLDQSEYLEPLLRAVKVTLARHHQLIVVCAWPPEIPAPPRAPAGAASGESEASDVLNLIQETTVLRLHRAFRALRQSFSRLNVPVICALEGDPVRLILDRLDSLRNLTSGRRQ